jgi:putative flippase GtrA
LHNTSATELPQRTAVAEWLRFLAAGGAAAVLNFGSRLLFSLYLSFEIAVVLAFCVGLASGFLLSRRFVFAPSGKRVMREVWWFLAVNLFALVQTWLLSVYLAGLLVPRTGTVTGEALAHAAGIMLPVVSSYVGHKYLTFRSAAPAAGGSA